MQSKKKFLGMLGCIGGLFIHLVIGSLYQWGIINIYITSYHKTIDQTVTLQKNVIAFPIMMLCIGLTMRLGIFIISKIHTLILLSIVVVCQSGLIFASSYLVTMTAFIIIYGVLFGLVSGLNFMLPIVECNKYFPGRKMYVNGVILTGTGLGSVVFGLFSYNFLNPDKLSPIKGYYIGNEDIQNIAQRVPECLRWLSLLYLLVGLLGVVFLSYVCVENRRVSRQREREIKMQGGIQNQNENENEKNKNNKILNQDIAIANKNDIQGISQQVLRKNHYPYQINLEPELNRQEQEEESNDQNIQGKNKNDMESQPLQHPHHHPQIQHKHQHQLPQKFLIDKALPPNQNLSTSQLQTQTRNKIKMDDDIDVQLPAPQPSPVQVIYPTTVLQAFKTPVSWTLVAIPFFGTCGLFLLNGNYKTYVKQHMNNDELLTIIGVMNGIGNGFSRFFWNLLFNYTGYRFVIVLNICIQIVIYSVLRFTVVSQGGYLFLIFMAGVCMGGFLVMTPTVLQIILGQVVGSNIYGFYWDVFGLANLLQFAFVSGLIQHITFNGVIYICLGMSVISGLIVIFCSLEAPWKNPQDQLRYCIKCQGEKREV